MTPRRKPPKEVLDFLEQLRAFTRPSLWRKMRALFRRLYVGTPKTYWVQQSFRPGDVMLVNGKPIVIESVQANVITLETKETVTVT